MFLPQPACRIHFLLQMYGKPHCNQWSFFQSSYSLYVIGITIFVVVVIAINIIRKNVLIFFCVIYVTKQKCLVSITEKLHFFLCCFTVSHYKYTINSF